MFPKILKITLMVGYGEDRIILDIEAPSPYPVMAYPASAEIRAQKGHGHDWIQQVFGRVPDEIIKTREKCFWQTTPIQHCPDKPKKGHK